MARLTGVGGRDSRRQAYTDVFTASWQASYRTFKKFAIYGSYFLHIPNLALARKPLLAALRIHYKTKFVGVVAALQRSHCRGAEMRRRPDRLFAASSLHQAEFSQSGKRYPWRTR